MKIFLDLSWSKYSRTEIGKISIVSLQLLLNGNVNILDIIANIRDINLVKKILETEEILNANEPNIDGMTALHIASLQGNLELVKLLIGEKNADIHIRTPEHEIFYPFGRSIKGNSSIIDFSVDNLDLDMTIYFLELGLKMPKVLTIFSGATSGKKFCEQLCDYFQTKLEQDPSFDNILKQVEDAQKDFYENTLAPLIGNSINLTGEENV
ncbi:MAG TPA: ankyrin repeat domain-containing protein [Rickettsia endosymbiont of Pyrocoelia pectoralis]|nr:ankyrin repeat domain-containing protein [Rickettsia endosymbiont of Pyrocoelia pectoralis]